MIYLVNFFPSTLFFSPQIAINCSGVNFTNILCAPFFVQNVSHEAFFVLTFKVWAFFGTLILAQKLLFKCWWNWHLWLISPTFYERQQVQTNCVNFTNILWATTSTNLKSKYKKAVSESFVWKSCAQKCWRNWLLGASYHDGVGKYVCVCVV